MRLSVIIPAHNAAATIRRCLESVMAGLPDNVEVIVADDGSTDDTSAIAAGFPCRIVSLARNQGPSAARNAAAREASAVALFFLDADIEVPRGMLEAVLRTFDEHPEVSAFFGSYTATTPVANTYSQFKNLLHHYTHQTSRADAVTFCGGYGGIRTAAFLSVGGFAENRFALEDIDLGYRLTARGHRVLLAKTLQFTHWKRYSLRSLVWSDLLMRAIPWTELMLEHRMGRFDLNTKPSHVASVALSGLILLAAIAGFPVVLLVSFALLVALNGRFLAFVFRQQGAGLAMKCCFLLLLMYFVWGIGVAAGLGRWWFKPRRQAVMEFPK